jgi:hypothetical protein
MARLSTFEYPSVSGHNQYKWDICRNNHVTESGVCVMPSRVARDVFILGIFPDTLVAELSARALSTLLVFLDTNRHNVIRGWGLRL